MKKSGETARPGSAAVEQTGLKLATYRMTTRLVAPAAPLILRHRESRGKEDPQRRGERLGIASVGRPEGTLCWIHAASVGETNAVLPLIDQLHGAHPDVRFLMTTGTVTSAKLAGERLAAAHIHQFAPLDAPQYVRQFLDHWRPNLAVLTESEIWPNTILDCYERGIPLAIVNGRLSEKSFRRWSSNESLALPLFNRLSLVLAQNEDLAEKFRELGARDVRSTGNIKVDAPKLPVDEDDRAALTAVIGDRPVWSATSTHAGEDDVVIAAHARLKPDHPGLLTIIAPRHPDRGATIAALGRDADLNVGQRSAGDVPVEDTDIYVFDTIGELGLVYSVVPVAFIGRSLCGRGGQNPIEAVRFETTVLTGPEHSNFANEYRMLFERGGAIEVADEIELAGSVMMLLRDNAERRQLLRGANDAIAALAGGLERTVEALAPLLRAGDQGVGCAS